MVSPGAKDVARIFLQEIDELGLCNGVGVVHVDVIEMYFHLTRRQRQLQRAGAHGPEPIKKRGGAREEVRGGARR